MFLFCSLGREFTTPHLHNKSAKRKVQSAKLRLKIKPNFFCFKCSFAFGVLNFELFLDLLFPKRCLGCKQLGHYICTTCQKTIHPRTTQICPECTKSAIDGAIHPGCKGRYTLDGVVSVFPYVGIIRSALRQYKYGVRLTDLTPTLIELISNPLGHNEALTRFIKLKPLVIPVPLYWLRTLTRGFNQGEMLGRAFAQSSGLPIHSQVLRRLRPTKPQFGLSKKEREENLQNAFIVQQRSEVAISSHPLILIFDDVWTTGSTLRACARVLKRAGAKVVWGLTVAH